jgi:hypothetical protein
LDVSPENIDSLHFGEVNSIPTTAPILSLNSLGTPTSEFGVLRSLHLYFQLKALEMKTSPTAFSEAAFSEAAVFEAAFFEAAIRIGGL